MKHAGYLPIFNVPALARRADPATLTSKEWTLEKNDS